MKNQKTVTPPPVKENPYVLVEWRNAKTKAMQEKAFYGPTRGEDSHKFIMEHVGGISPELFKTKVTAQNKPLFELRRFQGRADQEVVSLYVMKKPFWDWHSVSFKADLAPA